MTLVRSFDHMIKHLKNQAEVKRVAVVYGTDSHSEFALSKAIEAGFICAIMIGPKDKVETFPVFKKFPEAVSFIDVSDVDEAAQIAVELIQKGEADVLMKGNINTDNLLRAVLNKQTGILPQGEVLTHLSVAEIPLYPKLLFFMDAAVIPYPTMEQRKKMLKSMVYACQQFGIEEPKIGLIHFTEKVNEKFTNSTDYVELVKASKKGALGRVVLDGPLDISTACNQEMALIKGIDSPLGGEADGLMFSNIDAGNVFYKTLVLFGQAEMAGVLLGPSCPVVVTSRADSGMSKFNSIAMACLIAER